MSTLESISTLFWGVLGFIVVFVLLPTLFALLLSVLPFILGVFALVFIYDYFFTEDG